MSGSVSTTPASPWPSLHLPPMQQPTAGEEGLTTDAVEQEHRKTTPSSAETRGDFAGAGDERDDGCSSPFHAAPSSQHDSSTSSSTVVNDANVSSNHGGASTEATAFRTTQQRVCSSYPSVENGRLHSPPATRMWVTDTTARANHRSPLPTQSDSPSSRPLIQTPVTPPQRPPPHPSRTAPRSPHRPPLVSPQLKLKSIHTKRSHSQARRRSVLSPVAVQGPHRDSPGSSTNPAHVEACDVSAAAVAATDSPLSTPSSQIQEGTLMGLSSSLHRYSDPLLPGRQPANELGESGPASVVPGDPTSLARDHMRDAPTAASPRSRTTPVPTLVHALEEQQSSRCFSRSTSGDGGEDERVSVGEAALPHGGDSPQRRSHLRATYSYNTWCPAQDPDNGSSGGFVSAFDDDVASTASGEAAGGPLQRRTLSSTGTRASGSFLLSPEPTPATGIVRSSSSFLQQGLLSLLSTQDEGDGAQDAPITAQRFYSMREQQQQQQQQQDQDPCHHAEGTTTASLFGHHTDGAGPSKPLFSSRSATTELPGPSSTWQHSGAVAHIQRQTSFNPNGSGGGGGWCGGSFGRLLASQLHQGFTGLASGGGGGQLGENSSIALYSSAGSQIPLLDSRCSGGSLAATLVDDAPLHPDLPDVNGDGRESRKVHRGCLKSDVVEHVEFTEEAPYSRCVTMENMNTFYCVLNQKYVVYQHELGKGSFSRVHLAYNTEDGAFYAVKIVDKRKIQRNGLSREHANSRVQYEIDIMKHLRHKNIIALHEVYNNPLNRKAYLVMELAERGEVITMRGDGTIEPFDDDLPCFEEFTAVRVVKALLQAVMHAHHLGVAHRDIKPSNILLTTEGVVKLSDFGVSTFVDGTARKILREGSLAFLPPEMLVMPEVDVKPWSPTRSSSFIATTATTAADDNNTDTSRVLRQISMGSAARQCAIPSNHPHGNDAASPANSVPCGRGRSHRNDGGSSRAESARGTPVAGKPTDAAAAPRVSAAAAAASGDELVHDAPRCCPLPPSAMGTSSVTTSSDSPLPQMYADWLHSCCREVDLFKADVFSLGVTAFALLMGRLPWSATDAPSQLEAVLSMPDPFLPSYQQAYGAAYKTPTGCVASCWGYWRQHAEASVEDSRSSSRSSSGSPRAGQACRDEREQVRAQQTRPHRDAELVEVLVVKSTTGARAEELGGSSFCATSEGVWSITKQGATQSNDHSSLHTETHSRASGSASHSKRPPQPATKKAMGSRGEVVDGTDQSHQPGSAAASVCDDRTPASPDVHPCPLLDGEEEAEANKTAPLCRPASILSPEQSRSLPSHVKRTPLGRRLEALTQDTDGTDAAEANAPACPVLPPATAGGEGQETIVPSWCPRHSGLHAEPVSCHSTHSTTRAAAAWDATSHQKHAPRSPAHSTCDEAGEAFYDSARPAAEEAVSALGEGDEDRASSISDATVSLGQTYAPSRLEQGEGPHSLPSSSSSAPATSSSASSRSPRHGKGDGSGRPSGSPLSSAPSGSSSSSCSMADFMTQEVMRDKVIRPYTVAERLGLPGMPGERCYISAEAVDFIRCCLEVDSVHRHSVFELFRHPWIQSLGRAGGQVLTHRHSEENVGATPGSAEELETVSSCSDENHVEAEPMYELEDEDVDGSTATFTEAGQEDTVDTTVSDGSSSSSEDDEDDGHGTPDLPASSRMMRGVAHQSPRRDDRETSAGQRCGSAEDATTERICACHPSRLAPSSLLLSQSSPLVCDSALGEVEATTDHKDNHTTASGPLLSALMGRAIGAVSSATTGDGSSNDKNSESSSPVLARTTDTCSSGPRLGREGVLPSHHSHSMSMTQGTQVDTGAAFTVTVSSLATSVSTTITTAMEHGSGHRQGSADRLPVSLSHTHEVPLLREVSGPSNTLAAAARFPHCGGGSEQSNSAGLSPLCTPLAAVAPTQPDDAQASEKPQLLGGGTPTAQQHHRSKWEDNSKEEEESGAEETHTSSQDGGVPSLVNLRACADGLSSPMRRFLEGTSSRGKDEDEGGER